MIPETYERLQNSERAVSPVIGVILMVAITVILAAVIAAFVLGFGADTDAPPQASISMDTDGDEVTIEHLSGSDIDSDNLRFGGVAEQDTIDDVFDEEFRAGDIASLIADADNVTQGGTLNLVWESGDESTVLASVDVEDPNGS